MVADGGAYCPALYEQARKFADWDHRKAPVDGPNSLGFPASGDPQLEPRRMRPDRANRIDSPSCAASKHRRITGAIASIGERAPDLAANADTAYRFDVITRLPYLAD